MSTLKRGNTIFFFVALLVLVILAIAAVYLFRAGGAGDDETGRRDIFEVRQGDFPVIIPASGELAALEFVEIRNPLEVRAVITEIVAEGETVKAGDVLIRLADDEITDRIQDAEMNVLANQSAVTAAEKDLEIMRSTHESNLSESQLRVDLARLALEEWKEGDVSIKRQELDLDIRTAEKDLERAQIKFEEAQVLVEQEFISRDELRTDEIAFLRAESKVKTSNLAKEVYELYQLKREEKQKLSDVNQAEDELERVAARQEAEIDRAEENLDNDRGVLDIREERLAELQGQLEQCVVTAPSSGLVVYKSSMRSGANHRGGDESPPTVGQELRQNDIVMYLPDMSQLIANVKVHESLSGRIEPGQSVTVVSDALPDTVLEGEVLSIGVLAATGGWRDPNRRDYTVRVMLKNTENLGLKPSMRCQAEILLSNIKNTTFIPVQAFFREGRTTYVYVPDGRGYSQREVKVGESSELYVEILEGLQPGESVLLREPETDEIVSKIDIDEDDINGENGYQNGPAGPATPRADRSQEGRGGGGPGGGSAGGSGGGFMERLDANGDGQITRDELPEQMQGMFDRIDANGDGVLDADELAAMSNMRRGGGGGEGGRDGGQGRPGGGGGRPGGGTDDPT